MRKVYVFRTQYLGQVPMMHDGKVVHEVVGNATAKLVRFNEEQYEGKAELLNYARQHRLGDTAFLTQEEAAAEARKRLELRIEGLRDELKRHETALEQLP